MGQIKTHKKKSSTDIKKKLSLHHRINLDKLCEKYENFNYQVDDFNKILSNYSIPSFEKENDMSEIIQTLKSKSQKRRLTNPKKKEKSNDIENKLKTTIDNDVLSNFFNTKSNEIQLKSKQLNSKECNSSSENDFNNDFNFNEPIIEAKTHKKVKFTEEKQKNKFSYPKKTLDNLIETATGIRFTNQNNSNSSCSSIQNLSHLKNPHQIIKPIPRIVYNPDPRVPLSSMINYNIPSQENNQNQQQKETLLNLNDIKKDSKKIIKINNKYFNLKDDDLDLESDTNNTNNTTREDENKKKAIVKPTPIIKPKPKTKEEIYQDNLSSQIELVELKMKEFEDYSEYLPNNHPTLIQLKIDIINEKRKLKELLPETKKPKETKENIFLIQQQSQQPYLEYNQSQISIPQNETKPFQRQFYLQTNFKDYRKLDKDKDKEKSNTPFGNNLIFKYDTKIVEKEFQQKYMKNNTLTNNSNSNNALNNKPEKSKKVNKFIKNINQNQNEKKLLAKEQPRNQFNRFPVTRKPFNINSNPNIPFTYNNNVPLQNSNQNLIKPKVKDININEYKTVYCVSDDEDFPVPQKKVMVKEINNTTCEIPQEPICIITKPQHHIIDNNNDKPILSKILIQPLPLPLIQPFEKERKNKTVINTNKFKNKSRKNNVDPNYYNEDKEISPNKWNSVNYNNENDILTHIKQVKLTQKKVKDFLVNQKITNENKNIPTDLMNFLYSSITENSYQVKFIDVLN